MVDVRASDKRPYERPSLTSSEPFERLALFCNGVNSGDNEEYTKEEMIGPFRACNSHQTSS